MKERDNFKKFINKGDFTDGSIQYFLHTMSINEKEFINILITKLNDYLNNCSCEKSYTSFLEKLTNLLSILINRNNFNEKEIAYIKSSIKFSKEKILAYLVHHDNDILLDCSNTLDELVIDKNSDVNSLFIIIKELISSHEDSNIVKKFVSSNKDVLTKNGFELFDFAFNRAMLSLKNGTDDIYYYLTLMKIFYHSKINKMKYYKKLNSFKGENSIFLRQMYMVVQGIKRGISLQDINDKYGFLKPSDDTIYIPNRKIYHNPVITIDSYNTSLYDDALSIKKDGNKYIVDLFVADAGGSIVPGSVIDLDAMNNFKTSYVAGSGIRLLNPKIEKQLTLKSYKPRNTIKLTVILNDSGEILDYYLKENEVIVSRNMSYQEADNILDGILSCDFSNSIFELFMLSKALESKNERKFGYWKLKSELNPRYNRQYKSESIVSEFAVLYNQIVATIAKELNIPFVYRVQEEEYLTQFVNDNNLKINDVTRKLIERTYMQSKYSNMPMKHYGLGVDQYAKVCNPLREYPSLYNQYLLHQFYFKDIFMNFDYQSYLDMIEYFNKRSEEISLYKAEYDREARLIRRK